MARYKLLEPAYCKASPDALMEEIHARDVEIETRDDAIPGPHMEPLDKPAREAMAKYLRDGAPLDRAKVALINSGTITNGAHLPAVDAGDPAVLNAKMARLMEMQFAQNAELVTALKRLAA